MMVKTTRVDENTVSVETGCCHKIIEVPLTVEQEKTWRDGGLIQRVVPGLTLDQREILISGICSECFDRIFAPEKEN